MATKTKTRVSKSKSNRKTKIPKWVIAVVVLLVAVVGTAVVYQSFAALPASTSGYMDWRNEGTAKYSRSIRSRSGWLCVKTNFDTYNSPFNNNYKWYVEEYEGGQWIRKRESSRSSANGNIDDACYDRGITRGRTYRVKFDPESTRATYIHGDYWVYGYNVERSSIESTTTKGIPLKESIDIENIAPEYSSLLNN